MSLSESGAPILLDDIRSTPVVLERISPSQWTTAVVGSDNGDLKASEKNLQDLLARCPNLLPLQHFSSVFHPSVCIGREVATSVGPIDCLFISSQGRLIIVETKLYKNPEARRSVVAQLLDYCDQVSRFSYEQLDDSARKFALEYFPGYTYSDLGRFIRWSLKQALPDVEEVSEESDDSILEDRQFHDQVVKSIRRGEMLGLIVGDSIDRRIVSLIDFAQSKPGLALELGVVELAFHRPSGKKVPLLVVPSVIELAVPISRTVVDVRVDANGAVTVNVESAAEPEAVTTGKRPPQLSSSLDFLGKVRDAIPTALEATKTALSKMQEVADKSGGSIELGFQSATANLYWLGDDGNRRRFLSINGNSGSVRVWTDYLRKGGYTRLVRQVEEVTEPLMPDIRNQKSGAVKILDADVESLCELVESLANVFAAHASMDSSGRNVSLPE